MTDNLKAHIETLAKAAAETRDGNEAMRFSQAACNLANARAAIAGTDKLTAS